MYSSRSNLVIGFHGCEKDDQERLLNDVMFLKRSNQRYDWLGHGMYFWESDPDRALLWAKQKQKAGTLNKPASIGAVLDLGYCLDLLNAKNIALLKEFYSLFKQETKMLGTAIPENINHPKDRGNDRVLRYLDCAIIEFAHRFLRDNKEKAFDSVRAAFVEGEPIYPHAGFHEKTHIQICVINPNCIKGVFLPRTAKSGFSDI
jgi:hypothetical protein